MGSVASQITGFSIVYSTVCSGTDQRKHQISPSLAFVRGIHRWPANSPHKGPVTRIMFPFDDVIMVLFYSLHTYNCVLLYTQRCVINLTETLPQPTFFMHTEELKISYKIYRSLVWMITRTAVPLVCYRTFWLVQGTSDVRYRNTVLGKLYITGMLPKFQPQNMLGFKKRDGMVVYILTIVALRLVVW